MLTDRMWPPAITNVAVPSFCSGSDLCLLRVKVQLSHKLKKTSARVRKNRDAVRIEEILSDSILREDWPIKEGATEGCGLLLNGRLLKARLKAPNNALAPYFEHHHGVAST
ncbi:unnamed protein product [Heligmosomoides polygyrus]|uniref:DUF5641 domain-containing protein n=1 Tax=Heligmosomoides polygyrus TaxID=6339 RepID=A0A183FYV2_HELPZ|nr:unnamed protein product [Heligmosomoides polygyrus]